MGALLRQAFVLAQAGQQTHFFQAVGQETADGGVAAAASAWTADELPKSTRH